MSIRAIVVLSSIILAWVGRCWIIASLTRPPEWTAAIVTLQEFHFVALQISVGLAVAR